MCLSCLCFTIICNRAKKEAAEKKAQEELRRAQKREEAARKAREAVQKKKAELDAEFGIAMTHSESKGDAESGAPATAVEEEHEKAEAPKPAVSSDAPKPAVSSDATKSTVSSERERALRERMGSRGEVRKMDPEREAQIRARMAARSASVSKNE